MTLNVVSAVAAVMAGRERPLEQESEELGSGLVRVEASSQEQQKQGLQG